MAGWFDTYAKSSSQRAPRGLGETSETSGVSRRRVLAGGSVAVAAWTAPVLFASPAAAAGISTCPTTQIKTCTNGAQICCPNGSDICQLTGAGSTPTCVAQGTAGGFCGNFGQGICPNAYKCNGNAAQCNTCVQANVCGGEGAQCCPGKPQVAGCYNSQEGDRLVCVQQSSGTGFCRQPCSTSTQCSAGQTCRSGYCAKVCTKNGDCNGSARCNGGVCEYNVDGNLSTTCAAG